METIPLFAWTAGGTVAAMLSGAGVLHLLPRLGSAGKALSERFCQAPMLDLLITYFTIAPLIVGAALDGWAGLGAGLVGQLVALQVWEVLHEAAHPEARRGPRIVKVLDRKVGMLRNRAAVWTTALAVPLFWLVRLAELIVYPPLTWLVGLPRYRHAEWVNVSRQKFEGLVGHDLIWCLYCDWMTGIWSLGSEMLRNVESFWCPIRFASGKKCENCRIDFPDIEAGWVDAGGTMAQVAETLDAMYGHGHHGWFGHPTRLTVNGRAVEPQTPIPLSERR